MAPILRSGDLVLIDRLAYRQRAPRVGDLVAARPRALGGKAIVKRIAGIPQGRVECSERTQHVGADEYVVLGDRAEDSLDSRTFGPVQRHEMIGRVWLRLWPLTIFPNPPSG